ncbi:hypothetical protein OESDEN_08669 [Oesophagostomum dentatum]|uniref:Uncharacterized protein n=1 Tax=Oesophagostomum dentatum TaxID=61180 RepID=A0A0B1T5N8_OESDE|nr:hypothetical protein OESDEN_08669 [Oesophagostomum dentatum]
MGHLNPSVHIEVVIIEAKITSPIAPGRFYTVIAAFFVIDLVIIVCWIVFDPMQRMEQRFPLLEPPVGSDDDVMLLPILELCQSSHQEVWIGMEKYN